MRLLPKSIHWCRRYPTKFNSGRDIPGCAVCPTRSMARHLGGYDGRNENFRKPRKKR